jgi:hypothetical protein
MHNDARHFSERVAGLETKSKRASFNAYVKEAVRQSLRDQPKAFHNDSTVIYHRAFPIGSLVHVIEQLFGADTPSKTPEEVARRAILCGLCWQITDLIKMGGKGGFGFVNHDEGRALMNGVRYGRSGDAGIVSALIEDDDGES